MRCQIFSLSFNALKHDHRNSRTYHIHISCHYILIYKVKISYETSLEILLHLNEHLYINISFFQPSSAIFLSLLFRRRQVVQHVTWKCHTFPTIFDPLFSPAQTRNSARQCLKHCTVLLFAYNGEKIYQQFTWKSVQSIET